MVDLVIDSVEAKLTAVLWIYIKKKTQQTKIENKSLFEWPNLY